MGTRRFRADVVVATDKAKRGLIPGVVDILWGESDGEIEILYQPAHLLSPINIQALAQDTSEYPDGNNFILFTQAPDAPKAVTDALVRAQERLFGVDVLKMASIVANRLNAALPKILAASNTNDTSKGEGMAGTPDEDTEMTDDSVDEDEDWGYDDDDEDDDDEDDYASFRNSSDRRNSGQAGGVSSESPRLGPANQYLVQRIRYDLQMARKAGYRIGILDGLGQESLYGMVSVSIRANKLALPEEAMEAWHIRDIDYVVLIIRYPTQYAPLEEIIEVPPSSLEIRFRVGTCSRYRPSATTAASAFGEVNNNVEEKKEEGQEPLNRDPDGTSCDAEPRDFHPMFISNSLGQFMDRCLVPLLKLRETKGVSWDAANEELIANLSSPHRPDLVNSANNSAAREQATTEEEASEEPEECHILLHDHLSQDTAGRRSFPLVAMQFVMRYLVRCTEFCLVCHRRVGKEFEALLPYVCSEPLCLYQYMALGLGPNVEHEITTQPSVVDLLVSLCYASVVAPSIPGTLNPAIGTFPVGLRLQVPNIFSREPDPGGVVHNEPIMAVTTSSMETVTIQGDPDEMSRLRAGRWIAFRHVSPSWDGSKGGKPALHPQIHHALILASDSIAMTLNIQVMTTFVAQSVFAPYFDSGLGTEYDQLAADKEELGVTGSRDVCQAVEVYPYDVDFDTLKDRFKTASIKSALLTLPPIKDIRSHISSNPHSVFRSFNKISPPAAALLQWIICSNRTYIRELGSFKGFQKSPSQSTGTGTTAMAPIPVRNEQACDKTIPNMNGWTQFRFSQGSPDKELRFSQALRAVAARKDIAQHPTILGWHGSHISNWHSILRTGLHYMNFANGRCFGDGVYFSPQFTVDAVVSLNEIINSPCEFVSQSPHYVLSQLDWHQCRYLFVQTKALTTRSTWAQFRERQGLGLSIPGDPKPPQPINGPVFSQAPGFEITGAIGKYLAIPLAAMPIRDIANRRQAQLPSKREIRRINDDSEAEDPDDLNFILRDDGDEGCQGNVEGEEHKEHRKQQPEASIPETAPAQGVPTGTIVADSTLTDFRPGSLDISTVPRLAAPSHSTNLGLKTLSLEVKKLQAVQATTPLHELGWYIDFDNLTNLFQWIVELHTFDPTLPFAQDMKLAGITSIVLEIRFGEQFPLSPPFVRVVRPRFLPFVSGGGGHVTGGGAMCLELLTNSGWSPVISMESVILQVRLALCNLEPRPARLLRPSLGFPGKDYSISEAVTAYTRAANTHGWEIPADLKGIAEQ